MSYVELHCHSAYSFLDGASLPEELAARAAELGYDALALTDHDGVYGSLEFAHAANLAERRARSSESRARVVRVPTRPLLGSSLVRKNARVARESCREAHGVSRGRP